MYEMGELLVGAYLKLRRGCNFVLYNQRPEGGGMEGLGELDVVGISEKTVYLCEVTTHTIGMDTISANRIAAKYARQKAFAERHFKGQKTVFEVWSPVVPSGIVTQLAQLEGLSLVANAEYSKRVWELAELARTYTATTGNDAFRLLQILTHLREYPPRCECTHPYAEHDKRGCTVALQADFSPQEMKQKCQCKHSRAKTARKAP
jgi:Holliday junction resolvase-like predicted endonuclease